MSFFTVTIFVWIMQQMEHFPSIWLEVSLRILAIHSEHQYVLFKDILGLLNIEVYLYDTKVNT